MGRKRNNQVRKKLNNEPASNEKSFPWIPIVVALIAALGYIVVALINRSTAITATLKPIEYTQTAEALHTAVVLTTQAYQMSITATMTASLTPTPMLSPTSTPALTNTPMAIDHIEHADLLEMAPQLGDGGDFWYFKNLSEEEFLSSPNENGSKFYFYISPACAHTGTLGLQVDYLILEPDFAGWGLEWDTSQAKYFDASTSTKVAFWVKGNTGKNPFQIALKPRNGNFYQISLRNYSIVVAPDAWTKVEIPLSDFIGVDLSAVTHLGIGIFYVQNGPGSICIDDIAFE